VGEVGDFVMSFDEPAWLEWKGKNVERNPKSCY
jgi:hypothetical protein